MKFDSYSDLPKIWGFDVLVWEEESNYQGDTLAVLRTGSCVRHDDCRTHPEIGRACAGSDPQFGFLTFGWGSCSGCDALQACETAKDYAELADQLRGSIQWYDSLRALREALDARDWEASSVAAKLVRRFRDALRKVSVNARLEAGR